MPKVIIIDAEKYGLSPAEKKFNILKSGTPTTADLEIQFTESLGYGLVEAFLNGVRIPAQNASSLKAPVQHILQNGENKLVVIFNALQIFGTPLGQTTISASVTYAGASIVELPSTSQTLDDLGTKISKNIPTVIAITVAGAIAFASLAFVSSRLPSFGSIQAKNPTKRISSSLKATTSKIKQVVN